MEPIPLPQPIAYGRTAEIYPWQDGQVLKLYYDWFPPDAIRSEQRIGRAVHASGLPSPAVGEVVRIHGRDGLLYQRLKGSTMLETMTRRPWRVFRYARQMAELHTRMHARTVNISLPAQHQRWVNKINQAKPLPYTLRGKALAALDTMPCGDRLCHGDFHPDNILVTDEGAVIIDWGDASLGNPLADAARTSIILLGAAATDQIPNPLHKFIFRLFHRVYLRHYFALHLEMMPEYARWLPIVAAARLSESIPEVETWLIAQAERVI